MPKVISGNDARISPSKRKAGHTDLSFTMQAVPFFVTSLSTTNANVNSPMEETGNLGIVSMHSRSGRLHDGSTRTWKGGTSYTPLNLTPPHLIEKERAL